MKKIKNWKKWLIIVPVLMGTLLLVLSPTAALAQGEEETATDSRPSWQGALAIVAPRMAIVGQQISMRVFLRENQEPFEGAGVWAFTREQAETLRAEIAKLGEDTSIAAEDKDYEALADIHGTFLGRTGEDGRLYHTFEVSGTYVLAAFKKWYFPGFTSINVREITRALAIRAPDKARVGEEVTMTVFQRGTEQPVEDAGIWAVTRDNVEALKAGMTALREDTSVSAEEKDYAAVADVYGIFLGRTDENGQLSHAFDEEGGYLLIAVKRGYLPGFAVVRIGDIPKVLAIRVPGQAQVGEEVTMTVFQKGTEQPVEDAGIWAVTRDNVEALRQDMTSLRESASTSAAEADYESLANIHGIYLGRTDENGQLSHAFDEEGGYLLVAVKRGYFPGFAGIRIMPLPKDDVLRQKGVRGKGLDNAPGLQKPFNERRQPEENSGQTN